jgi:hypothetical protein
VFAQDEIYHNITYGEKDASALEYDVDEQVIVINSFSKYCAFLPYLSPMPLLRSLVHLIVVKFGLVSQ